MKTAGILLSIVFSFLAVLLGIAFAYQQTIAGLTGRTPSSSERQSFGRISLPRKENVSPIPTPRGPSLRLPPTLPGERSLKVPILIYHYISENGNIADTTRTVLSTPPGVFEQQLKILQANGFMTITLDDLAAAFTGTFSLPKKSVILSFDDGYQDFYFNAAPLLQKYNMKGMAFIPTGLIGGGYYLTWSQIEELGRSPNVVFGAHSEHHWALANLSPSVLTREIGESKRVLEQHVGYPVNWFAYPYGLFNDAVIAEVKRAGFIGAVTTLPGAWQYQSRFYYTPRYRAGTRLGVDFLKLVD